MKENKCYGGESDIEEISSEWEAQAEVSELSQCERVAMD